MSDPVSWGLATQKPEARLLAVELPENLRPMWATIPDFIETSLDYGNFARHLTYGTDGEPTVDLERRHSHMVIPDQRYDLNYAIEQIVKKYWNDSFNIEGELRLLCTQSEFFYYPPGAGIVMHTDDHVMTTTGAVIGRDPHRAITSILYLNDDYEGGEIVFPKQNLSLKPAPGTLVIFPSNKNFPHAVKPITSGKRMSYQRVFGVVGANGIYTPPVGMTAERLSCC